MVRLQFVTVPENFTGQSVFEAGECRRAEQMIDGSATAQDSDGLNRAFYGRRGGIAAVCLDTVQRPLPGFLGMGTGCKKLRRALGIYLHIE